MTDKPEPPPAEPATSEPDPAPPTDTGDATDWKAEAERYKHLAARHEGQAKANSKAKTELETLRRQAMTDQERAVAEAVDAAKATAAVEAAQRYGSQLVAAEVRAAAAGRLEAGAIDTLVSQLNVAGFLDEAGDVDRAAVTAFVDGLVPPPDPEQTPSPPAFPDLGQGARGNRGALPLNGDPLLRDLKAKLGVR